MHGTDIVAQEDNACTCLTHLPQEDPGSPSAELSNSPMEMSRLSNTLHAHHGQCHKHGRELIPKCPTRHSSWYPIPTPRGCGSPLAPSPHEAPAEYPSLVNCVLKACSLLHGVDIWLMHKGCMKLTSIFCTMNACFQYTHNKSHACTPESPGLAEPWLISKAACISRLSDSSRQAQVKQMNKCKS